jgi:hypothetical protein
MLAVVFEKPYFALGKLFILVYPVTLVVVVFHELNLAKITSSLSQVYADVVLHTVLLPRNIQLDVLHEV